MPTEIPLRSSSRRAWNIPPNIKELTTIGEEVAAGRHADAEQAARMTSIQLNKQRLSRIDLALIGVAVFSIATARYW